MTVTFCGNTAFREYLQSSKSDMFVLDLSKCTVVECVEKMCEIKQRSHPKIRKNYQLLINKMNDIERQFECTVMPAMVSSVFWNYFVSYLADQGLKYSTINNLKTCLMSVLNWSSKYGVKLNPSYAEVDIPNYTPSRISLTPDEISHIYHFKIGKEDTYNFRLKKVAKLRKN